MARINKKRMAFYLARDLAELIGVEESTGGQILRLKFTPNGYGHRGEEAHLAPRHNCCVACGEEDSLHRYSVVPHCFRAHMPERYKTHNHTDILLLCKGCYAILEPASCQHRAKLFATAGIDASPRRYTIDRDKAAVRSAANVLQPPTTVAAGKKPRGNKIPAAREAELRDLVAAFLGREASGADLSSLAKMDCQMATEGYLAPEEALVRSLFGPEKVKEEEGEHGAALEGGLSPAHRESLREFVVGWRSLLEETLKPRHLPPGWTVEAPVMARRKEHECPAAASPGVPPPKPTGSRSDPTNGAKKGVILKNVSKNPKAR